MGDTEARIKELEKAVSEKEQQRASLEERLATAEKDGRTKSEFLIGMGHELRTPMNGIMGMTSLVLESDLTEEQRHRLEMVNSSADQLLEVVTDILDFCRIESGALKFNNEDFTLSDSLDCDLYLMTLAARQKNINLVYQVDPAVPECLNSDPDRLVQVIINLVNNAIKFTEKGSITVSVENHGTDEKGMVILKFLVTDTGIGIPPEKQKIIVDSFNQNYTSYSRKFWGGGLGLTISGQLVRFAGGEIGLESSPGEGATFWFTWKCGRPSDDQGKAGRTKTIDVPEPVPGLRFEGARVLLAEDETISRVLIETLLEQAGLIVSVVENGRQAVDEALSGDYQAILMDIQMPVMDGLEATKEIRSYERQHGGHLPIIALTAHAMHGDREKCLQAGMDDYLPKPLNRDGLFEVLTRHLVNTALIADSESESQQMVLEFLIESGWQVTLAETGRLATYEASISHFDLILLDMEFDPAQGAETARIIRRLEEYSGRHALILGIGGSDISDKLIEKYRESGVDDFLRRPLDLDILRQKMKRS
jgi:CheY-like chemotaxis protein/nitrogen-specific signal transduction histidine kinase